MRLVSKYHLQATCSKAVLHSSVQTIDAASTSPFLQVSKGNHFSHDFPTTNYQYHHQ